jgi:hypothetical protein
VRALEPSGRHGLPVDSLARIGNGTEGGRSAGRQQVERCRKLAELGEMTLGGEGAKETQRPWINPPNFDPLTTQRSSCRAATGSVRATFVARPALLRAANEPISIVLAREFWMTGIGPSRQRLAGIVLTAVASRAARSEKMIMLFRLFGWARCGG